MKKEDMILARNDILILKELVNLKKPIKTTYLFNKIEKQHKVLKPSLDRLERINLIEIKPKGCCKMVILKSYGFSSKLIILCKDIS